MVGWRRGGGLAGWSGGASQESQTSPSVKLRRSLSLGSERPSGPWLGVLADEHSEFEV